MASPPSTTGRTGRKISGPSRVRGRCESRAIETGDRRDRRIANSRNLDFIVPPMKVSVSALRNAPVLER